MNLISYFENKIDILFESLACLSRSFIDVTIWCENCCSLIEQRWLYN